MTEYRRLRDVKFYKERVNVGVEGYNPSLVLYYNSSNDLVKVREEWRGEIWEQTISGTKNSGVPISQIIDYEVYYDSWLKV